MKSLCLLIRRMPAETVTNRGKFFMKGLFSRRGRRRTIEMREFDTHGLSLLGLMQTIVNFGEVLTRGVKPVHSGVAVLGPDPIPDKCVLLGFRVTLLAEQRVAELDLSDGGVEVCWRERFRVNLNNLPEDALGRGIVFPIQVNTGKICQSNGVTRIPVAVRCFVDIHHLTAKPFGFLELVAHISDGGELIEGIGNEWMNRSVGTRANTESGLDNALGFCVPLLKD